MIAFEGNQLSDPEAADCPECGRALNRMSIDDITVGNEEQWTRRFADQASQWIPGRYRCEDCRSEWWQFPLPVAS